MFGHDYGHSGYTVSSLDLKHTMSDCALGLATSPVLRRLCQRPTRKLLGIIDRTIESEIQGHRVSLFDRQASLSVYSVLHGLVRTTFMLICDVAGGEEGTYMQRDEVLYRYVYVPETPKVEGSLFPRFANTTCLSTHTLRGRCTRSRLSLGTRSFN